MENIEKTVYHYIYENNPKAEELKKKIAEIKSYRTPPFIEADAYYSREPWSKFGSVGGFVLGWGWFRDEYIYSQATEKDIEMAHKHEMTISAFVRWLIDKQRKEDEGK